MKIVEYIKTKVHNPLSTLSNIFYVIFGWAAFPHNWLLGSLMILLGIASAGFHWTRNRCWHKADIVAIYYVFGAIAGWLIGEEIGLIIGLGLAGASHFWIFDTRWHRYPIGVFGALCLIPYFIQNGFNETLFVLWWFALAFAVSTVAVKLDENEDGIKYDILHGFWHCASAVGIYLLII